jgi:hypothetical protein
MGRENGDFSQKYVIVEVIYILFIRIGNVGYN